MDMVFRMANFTSLRLSVVLATILVGSSGMVTEAYTAVVRAQLSIVPETNCGVASTVGS